MTLDSFLLLVFGVLDAVVDRKSVCLTKFVEKRLSIFGGFENIWKISLA